VKPTLASICTFELWKVSIINLLYCTDCPRKQKNTNNQSLVHYGKVSYRSSKMIYIYTYIHTYIYIQIYMLEYTHAYIHCFLAWFDDWSWSDSVPPLELLPAIAFFAAKPCTWWRRCKISNSVNKCNIMKTCKAPLQENLISGQPKPVKLLQNKSFDSQRHTSGYRLPVCKDSRIFFFMYNEMYTWYMIFFIPRCILCLSCILLASRQLCYWPTVLRFRLF